MDVVGVFIGCGPLVDGVGIEGPSKYSIRENATYCNVTVKNSGELFINDGVTVTVSDTFRVGSNSSLLGEKLTINTKNFINEGRVLLKGNDSSSTNSNNGGNSSIIITSDTVNVTGRIESVGGYGSSGIGGYGLVNITAGTVILNDGVINVSGGGGGWRAGWNVCGGGGKNATLYINSSRLIILNYNISVDGGQGHSGGGGGFGIISFHSPAAQINKSRIEVHGGMGSRTDNAGNDGGDAVIDFNLSGVNISDSNITIHGSNHAWPSGAGSGTLKIHSASFSISNTRMLVDVTKGCGTPPFGLINITAKDAGDVLKTTMNVTSYGSACSGWGQQFSSAIILNVLDGTLEMEKSSINAIGSDHDVAGNNANHGEITLAADKLNISMCNLSAIGGSQLLGGGIGGDGKIAFMSDSVILNGAYLKARGGVVEYEKSPFYECPENGGNGFIDFAQNVSISNSTIESCGGRGKGNYYIKNRPGNGVSELTFGSYVNLTNTTLKCICGADKTITLSGSAPDIGALCEA
jgi:hypothetical protein